MGLFDFFKKPETVTTYLMTEDGNITLIRNGDTKVIGRSHPNHQEIITALVSQDFDALDELVDIPDVIERTFDEVVVTNGQVLYQGEPLHNTLTERILDFMRAGEDFGPLAAFLNNLMDNPSKRSVDQLYSFLEHEGLSITEDGHFLAYKGVQNDFKDYHSGKFDNSPGQVHEMPRNLVDDNPDNHCSHGFHVGSFEYASDFARHGNLVLVKVNPRDAVSVPSDHACQKLRVCRYEVVKVCEGLLQEPVWRGDPTEPADIYFDVGMNRWRDRKQGGKVISAARAESLGYSL